MCEGPDEDFYPRPPCGGRPAVRSALGADAIFLSTPSVRRATEPVVHAEWRNNKFLSTPSVRRATSLTGRRASCPEISIHALRAEGDPAAYLPGAVPTEISIHALRAEGDRRKKDYPPCDPEFLSTPSVRRATARARQSLRGLKISIHALRAEGDLSTNQHPQNAKISIHALRAEGDKIVEVKLL